MDPADSDISTILTDYPASSASRPSSASSAPSLAITFDGHRKPLLPGAATSVHFEICDTPTAGRAVFATQDIDANTLLWRSDDLTVSSLLQEYRREVCGQCFGYNCGRDLSIQDHTVGFAFCSGECQRIWKQETGEVGVQAWTEVKKLVKKKSKEDNEMVDIDLPRPTAKEIAQAWEETTAQADLILTFRMADLAGDARDEGGLQMLAADGNGGGVITKRHRKAVQKALQQPIHADVMGFCVSGIIAQYKNPQRWKHVLSLAVDSTPYSSTDDLHAFTRTYLHLLAILPLPLLPFTTPEALLLLSSRDSHNAFGIRSLEDEGSELFGYGCWPAASYFNHSCGPNVEKKREGRAWEFKTARNIGKGEQLCITYLGGEERKMSRETRMLTLRRNWGFECGCKRCEEGAIVDVV
ncbi:protein lysine methyltransferase [Colletotrichum incanum]|uniref:Protein lysine methyltransferase n=1 Tax=Colletotrichum incanum TaxID=1573173 RepID=A0A162N5G1_COLIC|nr:protein lysine methyltransferase [Colletotrichum incanum]